MKKKRKEMELQSKLEKIEIEERMSVRKKPVQIEEIKQAATMAQNYESQEAIRHSFKMKALSQI